MAAMLPIQAQWSLSVGGRSGTEGGAALAGGTGRWCTISVATGCRDP